MRTKEQIAEYQRQYRLTHPDRRVRTWHLKKYGLTPEALETLKAKQQYRCAICGDEALLVVDHDHETGKIRGLLCRLCNTGIGALGDQVAGLEKAVQYLKKNG